MFSLYHETLGYEDSDDDGLSSYIFFSWWLSNPQKGNRNVVNFSLKNEEKKKPFFTISRLKFEFQSLHYKSMGQYIVSNQLLTSLIFHTTFKNTTTLLRLGKRKEDNEPSRLTHFTSTQAKQENTIMSGTNENSGSLRCILWAPLWSVQYLFTRAKWGNTLVYLITYKKPNTSYKGKWGCNEIIIITMPCGHF